MKTTTPDAVSTNPATITTTPKKDSRLEAGDLRMLGAQAHEDASGALRVRASSSSHEVKLNGSTGSPAEVSEANEGEAHRSKRATKKREAPAEDEAAERVKFAKVTALKLFAEESHRQAEALAGVAPQLAEDVLSLLGGLVDVLDGRTVTDPALRDVLREKAALARALENMTQAHRVATTAGDALAARCESLRGRVDELETERAGVRAALSPMPGQSLAARAEEVTETHRRARKLLAAYEEKEAAQVKAIDDLCAAQPPASAGFDAERAAELFDASDYERPAVSRCGSCGGHRLNDSMPCAWCAEVFA